MVATMARVKVCFVVELDALIPYYERDLVIIERDDVNIYINIRTKR